MPVRYYERNGITFGVNSASGREPTEAELDEIYKQVLRSRPNGVPASTAVTVVPQPQPVLRGGNSNNDMYQGTMLNNPHYLAVARVALFLSSPVNLVILLVVAVAITRRLTHIDTVRRARHREVVVVKESGGVAPEAKLNRKQFVTVWLGIATVVLMMLVPPWYGSYDGGTFFAGYHFLLTAHSFNVHIRLLLAQWFLVAGVVAAAVYTFSGTPRLKDGR